MSLSSTELQSLIYKFNVVNTSFYFGQHLSIKKTIFSAIDDIKQLNANCLQIFISNPMSGSMSPVSIDYYKLNGEKIKQQLYTNNIKLFIHSPYTFNFAKNKLTEWSKCYWVINYITELTIAHKIGAVGCVIHVGKYLDLEPMDAIDNMYNSLKYIISVMKELQLNSVIILETGAGQGTELLLTTNNSIDNFANFYNRFDKLDRRYFKICVDTCHIYSAGYNISDPILCCNFFREFQYKIGLENLALIHLNNSKNGCCSCVDRHENLIEGKINIVGITQFIRLAYFFNIPLILETPTDTPSIILTLLK